MAYAVFVVLVIALIASVTLNIVLVWKDVHTRRTLGSPADQSTYETLHKAWSAAPPLRAGLVPETARQEAKHLHSLLAAAAAAVTADERLLAWDGDGEAHTDSATAIAAATLSSGRTQVLGPDQVACADPACPVRAAVAPPLLVDGRVLGTLTAYARESSAALVRATNEVARWASGQLELAELDRSRPRLIEAEGRA